MKILNLTQHEATEKQLKDGVVEPSKELKERIKSMLTFEDIPTKKEMSEVAKELVQFLTLPISKDRGFLLPTNINSKKYIKNKEKMNFTMDMLMRSEFTMKNSNKTVYVTNTQNGDYLYIIEDNGTFENKVYKFNTMEENVMPFIFKYIKDSNMNDIYLPDEEYKKMFNKQLVFHYNQDDIDKETYNYIKNKDKVEIHINIQN